MVAGVPLKMCHVDTKWGTEKIICHNPHPLSHVFKPPMLEFIAERNGTFEKERFVSMQINVLVPCSISVPDCKNVEGKCHIVVRIFDAVVCLAVTKGKWSQSCALCGAPREWNGKPWGCVGKRSKWKWLAIWIISSPCLCSLFRMVCSG